MIKFPYSPKKYIMYLYRSLHSVYRNLDLMHKHYRPASNMTDEDIQKYRRIRYNECLRQINNIRSSMNLEPVKGDLTINKCVKGM